MHLVELRLKNARSMQLQVVPSCLNVLEATRLGTWPMKQRAHSLALPAQATHAEKSPRESGNEIAHRLRANGQTLRENLRQQQPVPVMVNALQQNQNNQNPETVSHAGILR